MTNKTVILPGKQQVNANVVVDAQGRILTPGSVTDSSGTYSFDTSSLAKAYTYDGANNVATVTFGPDRNGRSIRVTKTWANGLLQTESAPVLFGTAATGLLLSGANSGLVGNASADITVTVTPAGSYFSPFTFTPNDNIGNGTFQPPSVELSFSAPSAKFKYTALSEGARLLSGTCDQGGLVPVALNFTANPTGKAAAPAQVTATVSGTSVTLTWPLVPAANNGGTPVQNYLVKLSDGSVKLRGPNAVTHTFNDLTPGIQVTGSVAAVTDNGVGAIATSNSVTPTVGGTVQPPPAALRVATVNNHIYQGAASSAGNDLFYFDYEFTVGSAPLAKIAPAMIGAWYLDPVTNTIINTPGYTVMDLAVENTAGTLVVRFPFAGAGAAGLAVASGQNYVPLSELDASTLEPSLTALPRGYKGRMKGWVKASAPGAVLPGAGYNTSGGQQFWTVTGNSLGLTDILTPGFWKTSANALPPTNGASGNNLIMPVILGTYASGADPMTWFGVADSEGWGTGDVVSSTFGAGLFQRAFRGDGSAAQVLSGLNFAVPGIKLDPWISDSRLVFWAKFCRGAIIDIQTNNFGTSNVWTAAQAEAMEDQLYPLLRAQGISKIIREDFLARTTSTDSWATEANQTYQPGWGPGGNVNQYRAKLAAKVGTLIDQFVSKAQARGTDTDKYVANGTANYATGDGTHLTGVPLAQISTNLRTAMDTYS